MTNKFDELVERVLGDGSGGDGGIGDLLDTLKNEKAKEKIRGILAENPEYIGGLRAYKAKDEKGYLMSLGNFEKNFVSADLIKKMSEGKFLSYHNWM